MGIIIASILLLFLAGIVAVCERYFRSIHDGLAHERTEDDVKRRRWIANCLASRRRY